VRDASDGALTAAALDAAFRDCWVHPFDWVAAHHRFTDRMRAVGWAALREIAVQAPMHGYGDLELLPSLGDLRFLVTSGFRRLQESKIGALGIAPHFASVVVDAVDEPDRRGKEQVFVDLLREFGLDREEVLVVGDNAESELAAARRLGIASVQILRPGVVQASGVGAHVRDLRELADRLRDRACA